jgi:predicted RNase H-like HicB family nuclease
LKVVPDDAGGFGFVTALSNLCANRPREAGREPGRAYGGAIELTIAIRPEGEGFRSEVRELPGCVVCARTLPELGEALDQAVAAWLEDPGLTLLYLELAPGEIMASAVSGALDQWWLAERERL